MTFHEKNCIVVTGGKRPSRGLRALGSKLESAVMDSIETGHIPTQTGPLDPQAKKN